MTTSDEFVASFRNLSPAEKAAAAKTLTEEESGLFDLDAKTKRAVWLGVFALFGVVVIGVLLLIWHSWGVDLTTTTGTGAQQVVSVSHPDISAGWAVISAVIAGIVGFLVPSPTQLRGSGS